MVLGNAGRVVASALVAVLVPLTAAGIVVVPGQAVAVAAFAGACRRSACAGRREAGSVRAVAEILVLVLVATLLFVVFGAVVLVRRRGAPPPDRRREPS